MEWSLNQFPSQSAPEPDMHQRIHTDHPTQFVSYSVPGPYTSTNNYQLRGFATHPYAGAGSHQPSQYQLHGPGTQRPAHRHGHHQAFGYNLPPSSQLAPVYAHGQPFDLFTSQHSLPANLDFSFNQQAPLPASPNRDFDMDDIYDQSQHTHRSMVGPESFAPAAEATYFVPIHPSALTPVSVPAHTMSAASPEVSLPELALSYNQPRLHDRYTNYRLNTTSGDLSTAGSMLFAQEAPLPEKLPSTRVNHYVTVDRLPFPETSISPKRLNTVTSGRDTQRQPSTEPLGAPEPEGGIDSFCLRSFPHNQRLREALHVVMHSIGENRDMDLSLFLEEAHEGGEKRWKCRFNGDRGPCPKTCNRRDAALGHIRQVHINMLPVSCNGDCGDPTCSRRFSSPATKSSHARSGSIKCDKCHLLTSGRNITRHQRTEKCRQVATALAATGVGHASG